MNPVYISGLGAVSCAGHGVASLWGQVRDGQSAIREGLGHVDLFGPSKALEMSKIAIREAMAEAGWDSLGPEDGLILASTTGQIQMWEDELMAFARDSARKGSLAERLKFQPLGSFTNAISRALDFSGRSLLLTSACSASTQALAQASIWIQQGRVRRCLVGGVEVLSRLTVEGFRSLQLLSAGPCRPFDRDRAGINLSEGAGFICLESDPSAPLAKLSGWGLSTDAFHMTSPHPEGRGSFLAMRDALERAKVRAQNVSWVHCHGTGSAANDLAEGFAVHQLLGDVPASSTKGIHGHALAASGALETIICVRALQERLIPANHGLFNLDSKIKLRPVRETTSLDLQHVLKNTLGFGGNNAALLLSKPELTS